MSPAASHPSSMELDSRRRHPSSRSGVSDARLQSRMAVSLERGGAAHPVVAAAVLSARGRSGLGAPDFAARLGVELALLVAAEAGELERNRLPGVLRRLVPRP